MHEVFDTGYQRTIDILHFMAPERTTCIWQPIIQEPSENNWGQFWLMINLLFIAISTWICLPWKANIHLFFMKLSILSIQWGISRMIWLHTFCTLEYYSSFNQWIAVYQDFRVSCIWKNRYVYECIFENRVYSCIFTEKKLRRSDIYLPHFEPKFFGDIRFLPSADGMFHWENSFSNASELAGMAKTSRINFWINSCNSIPAVKCHIHALNLIIL